MSQIRFEINPSQLPSADIILSLLEETSTSFPNWSPGRMERALKGSSVIVLAWKEDELVGFARAISDFAWIGYLSQLAVKPSCQRQGIGKKLIHIVRDQLGVEVSLLLHAADSATTYYEALGFEIHSNVYRMKRTK